MQKSLTAQHPNSKQWQGRALDCKLDVQGRRPSAQRKQASQAPPPVICHQAGTPPWPQGYLEAAGALRQVRIPIHPVQAVHVHSHAAPLQRVREGGQGRHSWHIREVRNGMAGRAATSIPSCWAANLLRSAWFVCPRAVLRCPPAWQLPGTTWHWFPDHLLSVSLLFRLQAKPISACISMPCLAARVSARSGEYSKKRKERKVPSGQVSAALAGSGSTGAEKSTTSTGQSSTELKPEHGSTRPAPTYEGPVEEVSVVGHIDGGLDLLPGKECCFWEEGGKSWSREVATQGGPKHIRPVQRKKVQEPASTAQWCGCTVMQQ